MMKKGIFRIYITISCLWFIFFFIMFYKDITFYSLHEEILAHEHRDRFYVEDAYYWLMASFVPLPLYFVLKWIGEGFKKD